VVVDSFRFLPRSFRPLYEGRGPFPGESEPVWATFQKRLAESRVALLSSAGLHLKTGQAPFDLDRERADPEWGDPTWRAIPAAAGAGEIGVSHLHINDEDLLVDPEVALPSRALAAFAAEGMVAGATADHFAVMGFQDRGLREWKDATAPQIADRLREQGADGIVLAPV
jgi:D-proline reductase (dithiol) PrdB